MNSGSFRLGRWLWLVSAGVLLILVSVALAQPGDGTAHKLDAIRERMEKGQAQYVVGNFAAAAEVFESGYKSYPYSAFLFNAGVCHQKLGDTERALANFREYLRVDPAAPDREKVAERIAGLEASQVAAAAAAATAAAAAAADAGLDAAPPDAVAPPAPSVAAPPSADEQTAMKSLVVIETEPVGAPLRVYARVDPNAAALQLGGANPGWKEVASTRSPANLTFEVGRYHVLVEKFQDFNVSQADIDVSPGHVHHFKANLSQGEFMAFLRVSSNVQGAYVYIDDPKKQRPVWGTTPHGELVAAGKHSILVEAPGFETLSTNVELQHGEQREMPVSLVRLSYGVLRLTSNAPEISVRVGDQLRGAWRSGEAPLELRLPSGRHRLVIESDGRKRFEGNVEVPRGQVLPLEAKMIVKYPRGAAWTKAILSAACIGGGVYLGLESNRVYDELESDRRAGVLEEEDSRVTEGTLYAIGANAGFALGGVLAAIATYNFVEDPLPDSSLRVGKPLEFDDPKKIRPTASLGAPGIAAPARPVRASAAQSAPMSVGAGPAGLFLGGSF